MQNECKREKNKWQYFSHARRIVLFLHFEIIVKCLLETRKTTTNASIEKSVRMGMKKWMKKFQ